MRARHTLRRFFPLLLLVGLYGLRPPAASAQALGLALFAKGYTSTIWVNSFDRRLEYIAHGVFYPDRPITSRGGYNARYGMSLTGSGAVSVGPDGFYMAAGTATNPNAIPSEGDVTINLYKSGSFAGSAEVPFHCAPSSTCPWEAHFLVRPSDYPRASLHAFTVTVYRHVEGSRCGGELTPDLNDEPCHSNLIVYFGLPSNYQFTSTDWSDVNYLATPGAATTAQCAEIRPLCSGQQPPPPPPGNDPCAAWLAATQLWLAQMPTPTNGTCADWSAQLAAWVATAPVMPDGCLNLNP